jgi:hypothetical protein
MQVLCKLTGLKPTEIKYYWPGLQELANEVGIPPNELTPRMADEELFREFIKVCLHLNKIPSEAELRIETRELKTKTHMAYKRFGSARAFRKQFRRWLLNGPDEFKKILDFAGWEPQVHRRAHDGTSSASVAEPVFLRPLLPACLQHLDVLARGERPPYEAGDIGVDRLFELRTADAFRCLGFEVQSLGQGTGRKPDALAIARQERFAVIIDAKVRQDGYRLGTEDRKFLEYAVTCGRELQRQGIDKVYLVVIGPEFREADLRKLTDFLSDSPVRSVDLIAASALMNIVEESIRTRNLFNLVELDKRFFGNKVILA